MALPADWIPAFAGMTGAPDSHVPPSMAGSRPDFPSNENSTYLFDIPH